MSGGTFTDLILLESGGTGGNVRLAKVPSTPDNQAFGVCSTRWLKAALIWPTSTSSFMAPRRPPMRVLERKLCRTGLITTAGFPRRA